VWGALLSSRLQSVWSSLALALRVSVRRLTGRRLLPLRCLAHRHCCCRACPHRKLRRQVVEREEAAAAERQAAGFFRPIERAKLEANIKEFVRLSIRRMAAARPAAAAGVQQMASGYMPLP
jgi:hypothetical protein